ncbi:NAD(P)-dependent dehydrogenase (short-subunit alcohol dehydrogenase family) [Arthrobacter globiformis]|uniref:SDR family NAD(P)-dependent oxidoreductase n=1 Tax=Arthrobacter globiformis TaxID=1665 RepID=UPI00277D8DBA|nr:SDR family NAD(P)-dependent oxidoreductase [Arthrobacter globiformis]MDQ1058097.1 NAD(P)-dependent dehydrogenase (short-subunit alcohol dehydrogenase family) [Arthrobacter globiformis]
MKDFNGKVAFITGGASGAGFGQAQVFGRAGCRIVIADIRQDALDDATSRLRAEGIEVHSVRLDISDRAAYAAAADEVEAVFGGPPQLLFNTAGVNSFGPLENATYEDFDWIFGVNLNGVINGIQTFLPRMIASGRDGHIVTTSSMGGFAGSATAAIYNATKAALINLMESYAITLPKYGIGASVLCPASIRSNIADAQDTRPAHLAANSGFRSDEAFIELQRRLYSGGMDPVELAGHVKRAIENNDLYILPYPETKEAVRAHFEKILDAFAARDSDPEGAQQRAQAFEEYRAEAAKTAGSTK